jgi:crotonobetaine/carnitine-CoA ligase
MSEAAPVTHTGSDVPLRVGSAGKVDTRYYDVRVFDDDDRELPAGEVGEVVVRPMRSGAMFEGYWNNPEATQRQMRNCWFHTGDLGRFDADGYFYFVDRKKDYLRRRGENISSYEVEVAIATHPAVMEAAVVGISSELGEDEVKAIVVLRPGEAMTNEAFIAHCIDNMPYFAVPRFVEFIDDLPRTPTGKVQKHLLRERGADGCWDREVEGGIVLSGKRKPQVESATAASPIIASVAPVSRPSDT